MKFVSFAGPQGQAVAGVLLTSPAGEPSRVIDLSHPACRTVMGETPARIEVLVAQGLSEWAHRLAGAIVDPAAVRPLADVSIGLPLRPGKIVGAAFNFTDALAERGMAPPAEPVIFVRSGSTAIGPGAPILIPPDVGHVGYEAELAVVIGRRALRVSRAQAMRCVAAYTMHNDVSASELIRNDAGNFVRGKNLPSSAPLGPWLATPEEVPDPYAVRIRLSMDGRALQDGSTASMLFRIDELISFISHRMPLDPGDVFATGTPAGLAASHTPPAWLVPGATVSMTLDGLGTLTSPIRVGAPFLD